MPYVITDTCVGSCEQECVQVCPMDVIHGPVPNEELRLLPKAQLRERYPTLQLYIDPEGCICCDACRPECPSQAIYEEDDVPADQRHSIEANAAFFRNRSTR